MPKLRFALSTSFLFIVSSALAAEKLPSLADLMTPDPAPTPPAEWSAFAPPVNGAKPSADAPGISQWIRTAGPDETIAVGGYGLGAEAKFLVYGQTDKGKLLKEATVQAIEPFKALITLPTDLPTKSMYLVWPKNAKGVGAPVALNKPEIWYSIPRKGSPGETLSVFGRNLTDAEGGKAWVYLKEKDKSVKGTLLAGVKTNPYRVDVTLPADLAHGTYEVWSHCGRGGAMGWAALHARHGGIVAAPHLTIRPPHKWDGPTLNVKEMGAKGDGVTDDTEVVLKALAKANATKNTTILFPAGTYLLSRPISPVTGPDSTGMRIMGEGMKKTFIKGNPKQLPPSLMYINGGNVEIRDLVLDINYLGEKEKLYRDAVRPKHKPEFYRELEKKREARDAEKAKKKHAENLRKRKAAAWKKKKENRGKPLPKELQPPPRKPKKAKGPKPKRPAYLIKKEKYTKDGVRIINCVLDAERWRIFLGQGFTDSLLENCDIVSQECILGCPSYTRVNKCNFYSRADAGVMMYLYGGWCISVTNCTGQDYRADTYDTAMGRFFTVSAYGNRPENLYIAENQTFDLTVNPMHYNQNSGEQIMWEFMDPISQQTPTKVDKESITFPKPFKNHKINWYTTVVIMAGKGLGQYRQVRSYDPKTGLIKLMRPWKVQPDTKSSILICRTLNRAVVYKNKLDAKPRAYQFEKHIASCGVEPFGGSNELIVDGNTFHELRSGIAAMGKPTFFHLYANNTFSPGRGGIKIPSGPSTLGVIARRNTMKGIVLNGFRSGSRYGKGQQAAMCAFEHNSVTDTPTAVMLGNQRSLDGPTSVLIYKNSLKRGTAEEKGSAAINVRSKKMVLDRQNTVEGYEVRIKEVTAGK